MIRVVLADDHSFMRAGVEAVLRGSRYELVASVPNGAEALRVIARDRPDICVLDVRMPEKTGVEVLETLRSRGDTLPVILLTAELGDRQLLSAVRAGVNGIVLKEAAADDLLGCLDAVMGGRRMIDPDLLQRALDLSLAGPGTGPLTRLAPRERQIVDLVAQGLRNRDVAERLGMSEGTVKVYLHGIFQKLGVENRTALALLVKSEGPYES